MFLIQKLWKELKVYRTIILYLINLNVDNMLKQQQVCIIFF